VVRPPGPDVVQKDVVAVHDKADRGLAGGRTADSEEHVGEQGRVVRVALVGVQGAYLQQHRRRYILSRLVVRIRRSPAGRRKRPGLKRILDSTKPFLDGRRVA